MDEARVFGASTNLLAVLGFLSALLLAAALAVALKNGEWTMVAVVATAALLCFVLVRALRLEVGPHGLRQRNLFGSRSLDFDQLTRARIDVLDTRAPQGCPTLCLEPREGRELRIYLRRFPVHAAAALFTALEARGLRIEVPDDDRAHWVEAQVRAAQAIRSSGSS